MAFGNLLVLLMSALIQAHREDGRTAEHAKTAEMDDLRRLRDEIGALDRSVLEALNRRLDLVRRISEHKQETGAPAIDAEREAELLRELNAANAGPLSERGVQSIFT